MTEKITIDKKIIDNLVVKANVEPTGNTDEWNITNPTWVDGYKEGMLQAVNTLMMPVYLTDNQPTFAVGEYYVSVDLKVKDEIVIDKVERLTENGYIAKRFFVRGSVFYNSVEIDSYDIKKYNPQPATDEQIATFKRAEQFAAKGRKLDEFRVGDLIVKDGELNILGNISMEEYGDVEVDGCKLTLGKLAGRYNLIQTAEELQEVENNE